MEKCRFSIVTLQVLQKNVKLTTLEKIDKKKNYTLTRFQEVGNKSEEISIWAKLRNFGSKFEKMIIW